SSQICAHCCIVWCEQRTQRHGHFYLSSLLSLLSLSFSLPYCWHLTSQTHHHHHLTCAAPAKKRRGHSLSSQRSGCPAPKKQSSQNGASDLNPNELFPTSPSLLFLLFPSSPLPTVSSLPPHRSPHPVLFFLPSSLLSCLPPSDPASRSHRSSAPGFKFSTLLTRFPTLSVACDDFRFATPCEQARLLLLRLLFKPQLCSSSPCSEL
ncbi:uncharacterized protein CCOS01_07023, partial [Colletotrichum costaricense]